MTDKRTDLPDFDAPPVVETILGVEFYPLQQWSPLHFGLFWSTVKADFPRFESKDILPSQIERVDGPPTQLTTPTIEFRTSPLLRYWFFDEDKSRLIQLQHDRFIHNWRKEGRHEEYPRYPHIKERFKADWGRFATFLDDNNLDAPKIRQCEVTYVNHLVQGKEWNNYSDFADIFMTWSRNKPEAFLPDPELIRFSNSYRLPNNAGRLHITAHPALRHSDQKNIVQLTLTARGQPDEPNISSAFDWFDLGREWVVRGFDAITTPLMHKIWGKKGAEN